MSKSIVLLVFCLIISSFLYGQGKGIEEVTFELKPITQLIGDGQNENPDLGIEIEIFKFYIGSFSFYSEGELAYSVAKYHLFDYKKDSSKSISLSIPYDIEYDQISCYIGVDSLTNTLGAFDGDLDPINGMYWAWNSGYINAKIEGSISDQNDLKHDFQFHLGGYQAPFESARIISFTKRADQHYMITIDVIDFLNKLDLEEGAKIMSPSHRAAILSTLFSQSFVLDEK